MKTAEIYRDTKTARLGYRVREDGKALEEALSEHTDIRKLRRHLRRKFGKSVRMEALGA